MAIETMLEKLSAEQIRLFYEGVCHNLTISIRTIWSDPDLTDAERVARMKWLNEVMHRSLNRLIDLTSGQNHYPYKVVWTTIRDHIQHEPAIAGEIGAAIDRGLAKAGVRDR